MPATTPWTLRDDVLLFWAFMRALNDADRRGDTGAAWEALDDLDLFTLHADPSPIRTRAAREVARRGFRAATGAAR